MPLALAGIMITVMVTTSHGTSMPILKTLWGFQIMGDPIWIVATADIGVFTDIGDKMTRYRVTCHDIGFFV